MAKKTPAKATAAKSAARVGQPSTGFTSLEEMILLANGLSPDQLAHLNKLGVRSKEDFKQVGDSATWSELAGIPLEVAQKVMSWALAVATDWEKREYIPWEDMHIRE